MTVKATLTNGDVVEADAATIKANGWVLLYDKKEPHGLENRRYYPAERIKMLRDKSNDVITNSPTVDYERR
jgi:hypothetical protein